MDQYFRQKMGLKIGIFRQKNRYFLGLSEKKGMIALSERPEFKYGVALMCDK
jgi:hypothetical protein